MDVFMKKNIIGSNNHVIFMSGLGTHDKTFTTSGFTQIDYQTKPLINESIPNLSVWDLWRLWKDLGAMKAKRISKFSAQQRLDNVVNTIKSLLSPSSLNIILFGLSHGSLILYGGMMKYLMTEIEDDEAVDSFLNTFSFYSYGSPHIIPPDFFAGLQTTDQTPLNVPRLLNMYHFGDSLLIDVQKYVVFLTLKIPKELNNSNKVLYCKKQCIENEKDKITQKCNNYLDYHVYNAKQYTFIASLNNYNIQDKKPFPLYGYRAHTLIKEFFAYYIFQKLPKEF